MADQRDEEEDRVERDALHPLVFCTKVLSIPIPPWDRADSMRAQWRRYHVEDMIALGALTVRWRRLQWRDRGQIPVGSYPADIPKAMQKEMDLCEGIMLHADARAGTSTGCSKFWNRKLHLNSGCRFYPLRTTGGRSQAGRKLHRPRHCT
jgi:hypothetical protein